MIVVSIDTGATHTRIWDGSTPIIRTRTPLQFKEYIALVRKLVRQFAPIDRLIISLPAVIESQTIVAIPNLNHGWESRRLADNFRDMVSERGCIYILQDTEAAGYAVQQHELQDLNPTLFVALSSGVGGALVTHSNVLPLELGHMTLNLSGEDRLCSCGQRGCVEADLSGTSITEITGKAPEALTDEDFWYAYGCQLGTWLVSLICIFKLKQVLIAGGVSNQHVRFLPATLETICTRLKHVPMPAISVSSLGDSGGVVGGYWFGCHMECR